MGVVVRRMKTFSGSLPSLASLQLLSNVGRQVVWFPVRMVSVSQARYVNTIPKVQAETRRFWAMLRCRPVRRHFVEKAESVKDVGVYLWCFSVCSGAFEVYV